MDAHVVAVGAAAPTFRVDAAEIAAAWGARANGTVAVCAPDEDTLTLAWSAAEAALSATGIPREDVGGLWWATTRPPFADGPSHAYLASALGLDATADGALTTGSAHAGIDALGAAWDAVAAGRVRVAVVVASDAPQPAPGTAYERRAGAGAAAFVLGTSGPAKLESRVTRSRPVLDRYRGVDDDEVRDLYDPRLFREQVFVPAVGEVGRDLLAAGHVDAWSLPDPDGKLGAAVARAIGAPEAARASAAVDTALGDTGAAAALLGALPSLATTGRVAMVAAGGGRTTGVIVAVDAPVPGATDALAAIGVSRRATYPEALRSRGQLRPGGEPVAMGVPPGSAAFVRGTAELLGLLGARCVDCATISTPPSVHPTCTGCGGDKLEAIRLARRGRVHTFVVNQTMPPPFVAPLPIVVIDLDDGARLMVQGVGDGTELEVDDEVELVLRRYAVERGAPVYGYKARSVRWQEG